MSTETPETPAVVLRRAGALMRSFEDEPWVLAAVDVLDLAADWVERFPGSLPPWVEHALAIARAYLAGA